MIDVLQIKIPAQSSVTFKKADSAKNSYEGNQEKKNISRPLRVFNAVCSARPSLQFQKDRAEFQSYGTTSEQEENKYTSSLRHSKENNVVRNLRISKFTSDSERNKTKLLYTISHDVWTSNTFKQMV